MYADIIIDITHEKLDKVFQYRIPSHLEGMLKVGTEVVVPFGKGNKEINGYVTGFSERAEYAPEKIKEILRIAEESVAIESRTGCIGSLDERVLWRNNDPGAEDRPSYQEEGTGERKAEGKAAFDGGRRKRKAGTVPA